jgi:hypothetical protein
MDYENCLPIYLILFRMYCTSTRLHKLVGLPTCMYWTIPRQIPDTIASGCPGQSYRHRRARLLNQKSSITVYRWPTQENKLSFSVSVCSKHMEVCRFRFFPFAANKRKLPFSASSVFRLWTSGNMETWI